MEFQKSYKITYLSYISSELTSTLIRNFLFPQSHFKLIVHHVRVSLRKYQVSQWLGLTCGTWQMCSSLFLCLLSTHLLCILRVKHLPVIKKPAQIAQISARLSYYSFYRSANSSSKLLVKQLFERFPNCQFVPRMLSACHPFTRSPGFSSPVILLWWNADRLYPYQLVSSCLHRGFNLK